MYRCPYSPCLHVKILSVDKLWNKLNLFVQQINKTIQISLFKAYNLKPIGLCDIFSCNVSMLRKFLCIIKEQNIQGTLI